MEIDTQLDMTGVKLRPLVYCGNCMVPMNFHSNSFSCSKCGAQHLEK